MLCRLFIKNFILIESESIEFGPGLNILTGETGAGKTAILDAIALILGMRADTNCIRQGEEKALIEAAFDVDAEIARILEGAGIDFSPEELLVIRRELVRSGKNRAFVNGQLAPLPLLQELGKKLIDLFSQHSHQTLRQTSFHRHLLDLFAGNELERNAFQKALEEEKEVQGEIERLEASKATSAKEISYHSYVVDEITSAGVSEEEEVRLFEEYSRSANASELLETLSSCAMELNEAPKSVVSRIHAWSHRLTHLLSFEKKLETPLQLLNEATIQLSEAARELCSYLSDIDTDPLHMDLLKQRLDTYDTLKKKYGKTVTDVLKTREESQSILDHFSSLEDRLEKLKGRHEVLLAQCDACAAHLSQGRRAATLHLAPLVTEILHSLNMEGSAFEVKITPAPRSSFGDEEVAFFLKANSGESAAPVSTRSSGGELARLMLAITTLLAEKNETDTLLFDEIDANIGGETATKIGHALSSLGKTRQVLCITHFPQVAQAADHHFRVHKKTHAGRTTAHVASLQLEERERELQRMVGGTFPKSPLSL